MVTANWWELPDGTLVHDAKGELRHIRHHRDFTGETSQWLERWSDEYASWHDDRGLHLMDSDRSWEGQPVTVVALVPSTGCKTTTSIVDFLGQPTPTIHHDPACPACYPEKAALVSAVPGRSHVTHNIQRQDRRRLVQLAPGGGWSLGDRYSVIYCTGCPLRVEMPDGQADVGAAVARWNAEKEH